MAKRDKRAALFDLFDQGSNSQPGERQTDLEELLAEEAYYAAKDQSFYDDFNANKGAAYR